MLFPSDLEFPEFPSDLGFKVAGPGISEPVRRWSWGSSPVGIEQPMIYEAAILSSEGAESAPQESPRVPLVRRAYQGAGRTHRKLR